MYAKALSYLPKINCNFVYKLKVVLLLITKMSIKNQLSRIHFKNAIIPI